MNATWKAVVGVILVFILGWFGGALTTLVIAHHRMQVVIQHEPQALARFLEMQATRGLNLDDAKKQQMHEIIVTNIRQRIEMQKQIQPQIHAINAQTLQQIDALLTSDQQERFQENLMTFKQRFGRNPLNVGDEGVAKAGTIGAGTNAAPSK
jgi:hypothetical protein